MIKNYKRPNEKVERNNEIFRLIKTGVTGAEIARRMSISPSRVYDLVRRNDRKLARAAAFTVFQKGSNL